MPFSTAARNGMLDSQTLAFVSLHTDFPGDTGANEVAGLTREAATFAGAAAGSRAMTSQPVLSVPAGITFMWASVWDLVAAGQMQAYSPVGANILDYEGQPATNTISAPAHGLANDDNVVFYGGTPPAGLVEGTVYFVISSATDTFQVAATQAGAALPFTTVGDAFSKVSRVNVTTIGGAAANFTLQTFPVSIIG